MAGDGQQQHVQAMVAASRVPARTPTSTVLDLDAVYRQHAGFVWRAVRRLGVPEEAAEDVVHEVFLVVRRRLPDYDGRAALSSWLFGIARGVASNHRRGESRAQRRLELVAPPPSPDTPEEQARKQQAAALVRSFLEGLDRDKRLVFELSDIEGMKGREIADALDVNVNSVYSRLRAARKLFREFLAEHGITGEPS
jgi:RNA polymerase sigma-70 factor (ECF subfamily)